MRSRLYSLWSYFLRERVGDKAVIVVLVGKLLLVKSGTGYELLGLKDAVYHL